MLELGVLLSLGMKSAAADCMICAAARGSAAVEVCMAETNAEIGAEMLTTGVMFIAAAPGWMATTCVD